MPRLLALLTLTLFLSRADAQQPQLSLPLGHLDKIQAMSFSPTGKYILTADYSNAKLWETATGKLLHTLAGHQDALILRAFFSPDGKYVVTTSYDKTIKVWDSYTGKLVHSLLDANGYSTKFSSTGKYIYTTTSAWVTQTGKAVRQFKTGTSMIGSISKDEKFMIEDSSRKINVLDFVTGKRLSSPIGLTDTLYDAFLTPNSKYLITASFSQPAKLWDRATGQLINKLPGELPDDPVYSKDGKLAMIAENRNNTVFVLDCETGKLVYTSPDKLIIFEADFSEDGKRVVTNSPDGLRIIDITTGKILYTLEQKKYLASIFFTIDGYVGTRSDLGYELWKPATGKLFNLYQTTNLLYRISQASLDGKYIAVNTDKEAKIYSTSSGKVVNTLMGRTSETRLPEFSKSGYYLLTNNKSIRVNKSSTNATEYTLPGSPLNLITTSFSDDGAYLASTNNNMISVRKTTTGRVLYSFQGMLPAKNNSAFTHSGHLATVTGTKIEIREMATGNMVRSLESNLQNLSFIDMSDNGKYLVDKNDDDDDTLQLWDITTGKLLQTMIKYDILTPEFSRDSKFLLTYSTSEPDEGDRDYTTRLIQLETQRILFNTTDESRVIVKLTTDSKYFVAMANDSTAKIWNTVTGHVDSIGDSHYKLTSVSLTTSGYLITQPEYSETDRSVDIWDLHGKHLYTLPGRRAYISSLNKEEKLLATVDIDGGFYIWDITTGKNVLEIKSENNASILNQGQYEILSVAYSSDGKLIATSDHDLRLNIRDMQSGKLIRTMEMKKLWSRLRFTDNDEYIIEESKDNEGSRSWNVATGKLLTEGISDIPNFLPTVFSYDGQYIVSKIPDTRLHFWNAKTAQPYFTYLSIDSSSHLILDAQNRFDGDEAARKLLYFTCGSEVIELNQLKDQLWVPNLGERIVKGETINAKSLSEINICGLTPQVEELKSTGSYKFKITPRRGGLGKTILYVNGIETKSYDPQNLKKVSDGYELMITRTELKPFFVSGKENVVNVKAYTKENDISSRGADATDEDEEASIVPPNLYAVIIGVSDYKGDKLDLKYAAKDATDISNAIALSAGKLLGKDHVFTYSLNTGDKRDNMPEKKTIKQVFTDIGKKATANDILMVFFAGHGVVEGLKKNFYFLTADASVETSSGAGLKDVGISSDELMDWMKPSGIKAQKRILILDACNSGAAINQMVNVGKDQGYIAARSDDKAEEIKQIDKLNEKSGLYILAASASNQSAYELGRYSQGLLTYSLLKVMKEHPEVLEQNKFLNVSGWFNEAVKTVNTIMSENNLRQEPQLITTTNFNIGIIDADVLSKIILPNEKPLFTASSFQNNEDFDELDISKAINRQLNDISSRGGDAGIAFISSTDSPDAYILSGRYEVKGDEIVLKVNVRQSKDKVPRQRFEVKGKKDDVKSLAEGVVEKAMAVIRL